MVVNQNEIKYSNVDIGKNIDYHYSPNRRATDFYSDTTCLYIGSFNLVAVSIVMHTIDTICWDIYIYIYICSYNIHIFIFICLYVYVTGMQRLMLSNLTQVIYFINSKVAKISYVSYMLVGLYNSNPHIVTLIPTTHMISKIVQQNYDFRT